MPGTGSPAPWSITRQAPKTLDPIVDRRCVGPRQARRVHRRVVADRKTIQSDTGPEFAGRVSDQRAFFSRVELDFSRQDKISDKVRSSSAPLAATINPRG